ncbi:Uncharacterised protein [BD1-7 clade bacterium]|uniref:Cupin fold metalloprotein WbuC cupin domain-containing protein n=1 Tax=BD1-7 clade bacterium TaxID=2029982 RepID=A0A5S9QRK4_9GAMM|nr:Uncharacterised protein [BD1-7 clade bacterium]
MIKLDENFYQALLADAELSCRKRAHKNLHKSPNEPVQRLCIALKRGTYVRPHQHLQANKWELIMALKGAVELVIFDDQGAVLQKIRLAPDGPTSAVELEPGSWHTLAPVTRDAVIFEVKEGPYTPAQSSDFAEWAPPEGDKTVEHFLQWLGDATVGDRFTQNH